MSFYGMRHHAALARTDVSEERVTSIIRVQRLCKLVTALAVRTFNPDDGGDVIL
jgi:hypothetical protein